MHLATRWSCAKHPYSAPTVVLIFFYYVCCYARIYQRKFLVGENLLENKTAKHIRLWHCDSRWELWMWGPCVFIIHFHIQQNIVLQCLLLSITIHTYTLLYTLRSDRKCISVNNNEQMWAHDIPSACLVQTEMTIISGRVHVEADLFENCY